MASQEAHYTSKKTFSPLKNTPLISHSAHKFTISSLFSSASSSSLRKMNLKSATFRGLGCASAAEVSAPESLVRSSADWQTKRVGKKKPRNARKKKQAQGGNVAVVPDVWCSPGIGFVTDAASVDCLIARRNPSNAGRGRADGERNLGERAAITKRSIINLERINGQDSSSTFEIRRPGLDLVQAGQNGHFRGFHRSPGGLAEIMMFQTRIMLGGSDHCDQYRDLRLDVDNMSYEELLQLGDKIGYVNTGLREEEILHCLRRMKHSILDSSPSRFHSGMEFKCSICQEEYEATDEMGKLDCGHGFHVPCIKQWLLRKNACPVCKAAAAQC